MIVAQPARMDDVEHPSDLIAFPASAISAISDTAKYIPSHGHFSARSLGVNVCASVRPTQTYGGPRQRFKVVPSIVQMDSPAGTRTTCSQAIRQTATTALQLQEDIPLWSSPWHHKSPGGIQILRPNLSQEGECVYIVS